MNAADLVNLALWLIVVLCIADGTRTAIRIHRRWREYRRATSH